MQNQERLTIPESLDLPKVDALVVLGRNFQPGFDKKKIAEQRAHLSPQSRINALAAGIVFEAGHAGKLILSTGRTGGSNLPSEARAMKQHIQGIFKDIPDDAFLLEEKSIDTKTNVEEVMVMLKEHSEFKSFGLLTDVSHLMWTVPKFWRAGLRTVEFDSLQLLAGSHMEFFKSYIQSDLYHKQLRQDMYAEIIQSIPVLSLITSPLLHLYALKTRNPVKPNPYVK